MTAVLEIDRTQISSHPKNPRRQITDIDELAASIRNKGILEPLIVAPDVTAPRSAPRYMLIAGHRRIAAAAIAGLAEVPCLVRPDLDTPEAQFEAMLEENLHRADLTPIEEAEGYQTLLEFPNYTIKRISQNTGRSPQTVKSRLALNKLPRTAKDKIHLGQITLADAVTIAEFAGDEATVASLARAAGTSNWSWTLAEAKRRKQAAAKITSTRRRLTAEGVKVLTVDQVGELEDGEQVALLDADESSKHAKHKGFAATIEHDGRAYYVCTDPKCVKAHNAELETTGSGNLSTAEAKKLLAEQDQLLDDLQTAAIARHAALRAFMIGRSATDIAVAVLRTMVLDRVGRGIHSSLVLDLLGLDVVDGESAPALRKRIEGALAQLQLAQLAIALDIVEHGGSERALENEYGWPAQNNRDGYDAYKGWRARLTEVYGYEWTDVEQKMLARGAKPVQGDAADGDEVDS